MPKLTIENLKGGVSLLDPTIIKDNQFVRLQNMFYDDSKRARSRRGHRPFGSKIDGSPITSYFFFQRDDTLERMALATAGTKMYRMNDATKVWEEIKDQLTEWEPSKPSQRTRWSFAVYKNIVYMCNGVDFYMSYDGTIFHGSTNQPKPRYLMCQQDRVFGAGDDENPNSLYYTDAGELDALTINQNVVVVGGDELGRINGLYNAGQVILAGKNKKIYDIDVTNASAIPLDFQNGWYANRAIAAVGNGILYPNDEGIHNLQQRPALTTGQGLATQPLTADLQPLMLQIAPAQYNAGCGTYINPLHNYYYSFDTSNDNIPDTTVVRSSLTGGWSTYNIPAAYDYGQYIEEDGTIRYLLASAIEGQMYEYEYGFSDNGTAIDADLLTKEFDFKQPTLWKDYEYATLYGPLSEGGLIYGEIIIDGQVVSDFQITDDYADVSQSTYPIGVQPIGTRTIGGGGVDTIQTFGYKIKIPLLGAGGGQKIQVHLYSNMVDIAWGLDKIEVKYDGNVEDLFPVDNIC